MIDTPRLLSLEERILLGLKFHAIPTLRDELLETLQKTLKDPDKVRRMNALLNQHFVPALSTELVDEQVQYLAEDLEQSQIPKVVGGNEVPVNWTEEIDVMALCDPALSFVPRVVRQFILPASVRDERIPLRLFVTVEGIRYRVIGITVTGTFQLSTSLERGEIYDATLTFDPHQFKDWSQSP
ncbi:hypothetical protein LUCX_213 [Xanthomonas phage vB_XciM_LucasX]|nr:hypothetical protein LUCX_213 [Xanthomonas phage vB_XciM_LucasX]